MRFISGDYASIDQSALTGESLPVTKKIGDEAYSGSIVKEGAMTGVVIATGSHTFFGKTANWLLQPEARAVLKKLCLNRQLFNCCGRNFSRNYGCL